jgi:hypothetical protein
MIHRVYILLVSFLLQFALIAQPKESVLITPAGPLYEYLEVDIETIDNVNAGDLDHFKTYLSPPSDIAHKTLAPIYFKRLDFLSANYKEEYERSFGTTPPHLFSHIERGTSLINIVTLPEPIIQYHSNDGNYALSNDKSTTQWIKHSPQRSIVDFCNTQDEPIDMSYDSIQLKSNLDSIPSISIYLEIDYHTFLDFDMDLQSINDWAILLFSEVAAVYAIDGIDIMLEEVFIWRGEDIFDLDTGPFQVLNVFSDKILSNTPRADAHLLLSTRYISGVANLQSLCLHDDLDNPIAAAGIATGLEKTTSFNHDYNWSTYVISHELGHILGSRHTHACIWLDGSQALDDCASTEGSCDRGDRPGQGEGTIMSYCHRWQSIGINFTNGLGKEPSTLIKANIRNQACSLPSMCHIGTPCDDDDRCTINDRFIDDYCSCIGDLLDVNFNDICDLDENCPDTLVIHTIQDSIESHIAGYRIESQTNIAYNQTVYFSTSNEIILSEGFEISFGGQIECLQYGCSEEE